MSCFRIALASLLLIAAGSGQSSFAQCIFSNPSFEVVGSGGAVFGGWNQFGVVTSSPNATHGHAAARVTGPNSGGWDVSGYWQAMDSAPGDRWNVSVRVWHESVRPLTGQCTALVNVEWRSSSGSLISYESYAPADASTPTGEVQDFSVTTGPAPAGTAEARLLLGVLQSPTDPAPDVTYDQATFDEIGPPSIDDIQWNDFPGGRTIDFSGYTWRVKGPGYYGPGPSVFSDDPSSVWADGTDRLHLTIRNSGGSWTSTEVALEDTLGYGDYIFTTVGSIDTLDPRAVLGLFLWQYGPCWDPAYFWWNPYNEIDVEISRWGNPSNDVAQFVAQPYDWPGNLSRFDASWGDGELASFAFRWLPDRVEFRSWRGGPGEESPGASVHSWTYIGPHVPRPEQPRVHINLWQYEAPPGTNQEVVFDAFTFVPAGTNTEVAEWAEPLPAARPAARLFPARPNPFNPSATIVFFLESGGFAMIDVFDPAGRRVAGLASGFFPAGNHETVWDGRDAEGRPAASGVYLYRLRAGDVFETRRMVLVR
jgi:hypothetical protein